MKNKAKQKAELKQAIGMLELNLDCIKPEFKQKYIDKLADMKNELYDLEAKAKGWK